MENKSRIFGQFKSNNNRKTQRYQSSPSKKHYQEFVFGKICTATYQQYPMKSHQKMTLLEKIEALEKEAISGYGY